MIVKIFLLAVICITNFGSMTKNHSVISPEALRTSLIIVQKLKDKGQLKSNIVTIIDFTKPSDEPRLEVINVDTKEVLLTTYVAHGSGSGSGRFATHFSNQDGSHATSIGVYRTLRTYISSKNGYSLQITGLEPGYNSNARSRSVVVHPAYYIGYGKTGHTWGCFGVPPDKSRQLINIIKDGTTIIAYYPDSSWLKHSRYING